MFDPSEVTYAVYAFDESGRQHNIKNFVTNLGWEQNPGELATRISFTVRDKVEDETIKKLSKVIKPGCLVTVTAKAGNTKGTCARGYVTTWNPKDSSKRQVLKVVAYDELFNLQKSQHQIYFSSGADTKTVIQKVFSVGGIPMGSYDGPNVAHEKLLYDTESLAEVIYSVLDDAVKKGGSSAFLRAKDGKVSVLRWGSNKDVWVFKGKNALEMDYKISTDDMVTRVIVLGKADDEGRKPLEATVNGETKYGLRQKIYNRSEDESLADAQKAAQEILDEEGKPGEDIRLTAPDIPFLQKGDLVYADKVGYINGYYFIKGVAHNADNYEMTLQLTKKESED